MARFVYFWDWKQSMLHMKQVVILLLAAASVCACGTSRNAATSYTSDQDELVNIGYQSIPKKNATSSSSTIKVERGSGYANIYDYISGRVAGVDVVGTTIRIRGERSINSSNEPLILVDGMETSDISNISPEEVSSIDVLKDAATTAIYGSRGANGVILIHTRRNNK